MNDAARILRLKAYLEYTDAIRLLREYRVDVKAVDKFNRQFEGRARGNRTKGEMSIAQEQRAVAIVKMRKDLLKQEGKSTYDAWKQAFKEVARAFGPIRMTAAGPKYLTVATLKDWARGVPKRRRSKPIDEREYRKRKRKKQK